MLRVERWSGGPVLDAGELRRQMEADGYRVYMWTDESRTIYPPHKHPTDQSHWVLHGSMALTVGEQEYVLGPGDRDYLPAGTQHSARVVGGEPVTYLVGERRFT